MSTTALTIITDALKEIGVIDEAETPSASTANDALRALNRLMEIHSNDQSFAYYPSEISITAAGESSFTIGPSGVIVTSRPIKVETATMVRDGITYPVRVVDNQLWDSIINKTIAGGDTTYVWYEATMPNGVLRVWPQATGVTIKLRVINLVTSFPDLSTSLSMPPGYEEAFIKMLAVNLSPQYPAGVLSPVTVLAAKNAMKMIKRTNNVIPTMNIDRAVMGFRGGSYAAFIGGE